MALKEARKKLERSIDWLVAHYPREVVLPELRKLRSLVQQHIDGPAAQCEEDLPREP